MLNKRQRDFCKHYIVTGIATESAKLSGYCTKSQSALGTTASRLLKKAEIKEEIERLTKEVNADLKVSCAYISRKLKGIVENEDTSTSDKIRALELLGKNLGYQKQDNQTLALFGSDLILKLTNKVRTSLNRVEAINVQTDDVSRETINVQSEPNNVQSDIDNVVPLP